MKHCVYCGDYFQCRDHVIPISYRSTFRHFSSGEIVPCCRQCNTLAGDHVALTVQEKVMFLQRKYEALLKRKKSPVWTEGELRSLDFGLQTLVRRKSYESDLIRQKIKNLESVIFDLEITPIHESQLTPHTSDPVRELRTSVSKEETVVEILRQPVPDGVALPTKNRTCCICGSVLYSTSGVRRVCSKRCLWIKSDRYKWNKKMRMGH